MPYGGFFVPPITPETAQPSTQQPQQSTYFNPAKKVEPVRQLVTKTETHIDVDIVTAVIEERNQLELKWLEEILGLVKVRNPRTGRYLKPERFLQEIRRIKENGNYRTYSEVQSDSEQE